MITQPGQGSFELSFADTIQDPKKNDGSLLVSGRCPSPIMNDRQKYTPHNPHRRDLPDINRNRIRIMSQGPGEATG